MVRRKPRGPKANKNAAIAVEPTKKVPIQNLLTSALLDSHDTAFNSPKRKESKVDRVLTENGAGKQNINGKMKSLCPATHSNKKISEYFAKLPTNGIISVQNGHVSCSDDSCDSSSNDKHQEISMDQKTIAPAKDHAENQLQKFSNGPILLPEAQVANTNLFLQEPVLKLDIDKSEAISNGTQKTIKTSFLSTKFQSLPPVEYINKVLNVNGSHNDANGTANANELQHKNGFLLNSDHNSSDSGIVFNGADFDGGVMKSPLNVGGKRRKPTTPHRMILCPSPPKIIPIVVQHDKQEAEIVKPSRTKNRAKTKLQLTSEDAMRQDQDKTIKKPEEIKPHKTKVSAADNNKKVTEFFTVRRSVRKTKKEVQAERMRNIEQAIFEEREEGLAVKEFPCKGRGVVTTRPFQRGEFVVEYIGDLISMAEANSREKKYAADDNTGCYMYYFKHNEQQYCIDATKETGKLGRLVNHSRNGNLVTKTVMIGKHPHLVLIAKDDLPAGVEITYDYGDRSKEALLHHPWLAF